MSRFKLGACVFVGGVEYCSDYAGELETTQGLNVGPGVHNVQLFCHFASNVGKISKKKKCKFVGFWKKMYDGFKSWEHQKGGLFSLVLNIWKMICLGLVVASCSLLKFFFFVC